MDKVKTIERYQCDEKSYARGFADGIEAAAKVCHERAVFLESRGKDPVWLSHCENLIRALRPEKP